MTISVTAAIKRARSCVDVFPRGSRYVVATWVPGWGWDESFEMSFWHARRAACQQVAELALRFLGHENVNLDAIAARLGTWNPRTLVSYVRAAA